jgi:parallel beta-helix repeat protein
MKPRTSAFVIILLIGGLVLAGTMNLDIARAATNVSGIISSDATWTKSNSPYSLTGNVLVSNGVTLTVEPGVTVNLEGYYIMVNGTLRARGTSTEKISFIGRGNITFIGSSTAWNEQTDSGCIVENAIFSSTTIVSSNSVKISISTFDSGISRYVTSYPISGYGSTIISNNVIKGDVDGGVISGNTITGNVHGNIISNNHIIGSVRGDTVSNNTIIGGVSAMGDCIISSNIITGNGASTGIAAGTGAALAGEIGGHPTIQNNLIANCTTSIYIDVLVRDWFSPNIPIVQNNLILGNDVGIYFEINTQEAYTGRPTIIQNNAISQNSIGIKLAGLMQQCEIQNNNIQDNINYNIYMEAHNNFDATYNWWGTTDTDKISQSIYDYKNDFTLGKVNFEPFLTSPNPDAPAIPATLPTSIPTPSPNESPSTPTQPPTSPSTPTSTPNQQPTLTPEQVTLIVGAVIVAVVVGAAAGLLIYLIKKK